MERLESEIGPGGYLGGGGAVHAAAAAPERPYLPAAEFPEPLRQFCSEVEGMEGSTWAFDMYRRHMGVSAEIGANVAPKSDLVGALDGS